MEETLIEEPSAEEQLEFTVAAKELLAPEHLLHVGPAQGVAVIRDFVFLFNGGEHGPAPDRHVHFIFGGVCRFFSCSPQPSFPS